MSNALEPGPLPGDLERFRRVADAMPHLAWLSDPSGRIEFVNQPWVDYTGIGLESLQNQMLQGQIVGIVHPGERDSTIKLWKAALAESRPYEIEYRLRRNSDNSYRWFIARALPIRESGAGLRSHPGQRRGRGGDLPEFCRRRDQEFCGLVLRAVGHAAGLAHDACDRTP